MACQANSAQVLAELKEYVTKVDVDFVCKVVWGIRQYAIKLEQSAERCVSTLPEIRQTKVNYMVKMQLLSLGTSSASTPISMKVSLPLRENLDLLDKPDAQAAMIWIVGEYCEQMDNADELLESFLKDFHNENTQV